jgi:hypothetical protein
MLDKIREIYKRLAPWYDVGEHDMRKHKDEIVNRESMSAAEEAFNLIASYRRAGSVMQRNHRGSA